jgi:hypothetical protein
VLSLEMSAQKLTNYSNVEVVFNDIDVFRTWLHSHKVHWEKESLWFYVGKALEVYSCHFKHLEDQHSTLAVVAVFFFEDGKKYTNHWESYFNSSLSVQKSLITKSVSKTLYRFLVEDLIACTDTICPLPRKPQEFLSPKLEKKARLDCSGQKSNKYTLSGARIWEKMISDLTDVPSWKNKLTEPCYNLYSKNPIVPTLKDIIDVLDPDQLQFRRDTCLNFIEKIITELFIAMKVDVCVCPTIVQKDSNNDIKEAAISVNEEGRSINPHLFVQFSKSCEYNKSRKLDVPQDVLAYWKAQLKQKIDTKAHDLVFEEYSPKDVDKIPANKAEEDNQDQEISSFNLKENKPFFQPSDFYAGEQFLVTKLTSTILLLNEFTKRQEVVDLFKSTTIEPDFSSENQERSEFDSISPNKSASFMEVEESEVTQTSSMDKNSNVMTQKTTTGCPDFSEMSKATFSKIHLFIHEQEAVKDNQKHALESLKDKLRVLGQELQSIQSQTTQTFSKLQDGLLHPRLDNICFHLLEQVELAKEIVKMSIERETFLQARELSLFELIRKLESQNWPKSSFPERSSYKTSDLPPWMSNTDWLDQNFDATLETNRKIDNSLNSRLESYLSRKEIHGDENETKHTEKTFEEILATTENCLKEIQGTNQQFLDTMIAISESIGTEMTQSLNGIQAHSTFIHSAWENIHQNLKDHLQIIDKSKQKLQHSAYSSYVELNSNQVKYTLFQSLYLASNYANEDYLLCADVFVFLPEWIKKDPANRVYFDCPDFANKYIKEDKCSTKTLFVVPTRNIASELGDFVIISNVCFKNNDYHKDLIAKIQADTQIILFNKDTKSELQKRQTTQILLALVNLSQQNKISDSDLVILNKSMHEKAKITCLDPGKVHSFMPLDYLDYLLLFKAMLKDPKGNLQTLGFDSFSKKYANPELKYDLKLLRVFANAYSEYFVMN